MNVNALRETTVFKKLVSHYGPAVELYLEHFVKEQLAERQIDVIDQKDLERICEEVQEGLTVQYERFEY